MSGSAGIWVGLSVVALAALAGCNKAWFGVPPEPAAAPAPSGVAQETAAPTGLSGVSDVPAAGPASAAVPPEPAAAEPAFAAPLSPRDLEGGPGRFVSEPRPSAAAEPTPPIVRAPACTFPGLQLPDDVAVFAAGAYAGRKTGRQIDQSGHEATQMDVTVNFSAKPVVLLLGAYQPTIWKLRWSEGTRILGVFASGYHDQMVAGLAADVPQLISTHDNRGPCGYFYVAEDQVRNLNPAARRALGRNVDLVYLANDGQVLIGDAPSSMSRMHTSAAASAEALLANAPLTGPAGLEDAVGKGLLRPAKQSDVDAWITAVQEDDTTAAPLIAGQGRARPEMRQIFRGYVVLKPFVYPAGLYGAHSATFFIPKGVPRPGGNPGHSDVFDFNSITCQGPGCRLQR